MKGVDNLLCDIFTKCRTGLKPDVFTWLYLVLVVHLYDGMQNRRPVCVFNGLVIQFIEENQLYLLFVLCIDIRQYVINALILMFTVIDDLDFL